MLEAVVLFATEAANGEETSKTPFYVAGLLLVGWAVAVAALGIRQHQDWPAAKGLRNGIIGLTALLVLATAATSVLTS